MPEHCGPPLHPFHQGVLTNPVLGDSPQIGPGARRPLHESQSLGVTLTQLPGPAPSQCSAPLSSAHPSQRPWANPTHTHTRSHSLSPVPLQALSFFKVSAVGTGWCRKHPLRIHRPDSACPSSGLSAVCHDLTHPPSKLLSTWQAPALLFSHSPMSHRNPRPA